MVAIGDSLKTAVNQGYLASTTTGGQDKLAHLVRRAMDGIAEALNYLGKGDSSLMSRVVNCSAHMNDLQGFANFFNVSKDIKDSVNGTYLSSHESSTRELLDNTHRISQTILNFTTMASALRARNIVGVSEFVKPLYEKVEALAESLFCSLNLIRDGYKFKAGDEGTSLLQVVSSALGLSSVVAAKYAHVLPSYVAVGTGLAHAATAYRLHVEAV